MESALNGIDDIVKTVPHHVDTCDLLSIVDVLVTDYSSIFFDFLPTRRPIIFFAYDKEEYSAGRGMYMQVDDLPGIVQEDVEKIADDICHAISHGVLDAERHENFIASFSSHEDGLATKRCVEFFFNDSAECLVDRYEDDRKSLVFYNGMFPANGITSSCLNLLRALEKEPIQVSMLFAPAQIRIDPVRAEKFESMPESVKCIGREGRMVVSPEEIWIEQRYVTNKEVFDGEMRDVLLRSYFREYRRVFGWLKHDAVINFEGYNSEVSTILSTAPEEVAKIIYLHNDMVGERDLKLPYLNRIFSIYNNYDFLVSVSELMSDVNREKLSRDASVNEQKFIHCTNTIDVEKILHGASLELDEDLKPWFGKGSTFITLGRLSPEKDHAKLIVAFHALVERHPDAKLVILGDGPLRGALTGLVAELGLHNKVKLAGLRMNPFAALAAADCFVLPSNHEGQPMVLLEAMVLGKPIIATDIDGNRGALRGHYGCLVENNSDAFSKAMGDFITGHVEGGKFDVDKYQKAAVLTFMNIVDSARQGVMALHGVRSENDKVSDLSRKGRRV